MPLLILSLTVAATALADIPPDNSTQCRSASAGAPCTTDDGKPGTCVSQKVGRLDYSEGVPPKSVQVDMLICVPSVSAKSVVPATTPFLASGLVLAVMLGLLVMKVAGRRRVGAA
ncbi:MAG: hypothetical protein JNJ54_16220 [Myxococcaceae bacterium]|nr:hypothetical protein [Myxococcaceae bacterium]